MYAAGIVRSFCLPFLILSVLTLGCRQGETMKLNELHNAVDKDEVTLIVTDSGLGGLAVCADIVEKAKERKQFALLHVIFCNALPESNRGYNRMSTSARKAQVFDDALTGMVDAFHPDALLIACNTLSVVYPETRFSRTTSIPVVGIVDIGVDMLHERLLARPGSSAIIFGTETTIGSNAHKSQLVALGIAPERLVSQACPNLAGEIESDARSERVATAIDLFAEDAVQHVSPDADTVFAGLCCTHYGYCAGTFAAAVHERSRKPVEIVDPTQQMSEVVFSADRAHRYPEARVTVSVVSRAIITPAEIASIGGLLEQRSPETAAALRQYQLKRDLFPYAAE
jgi:glutamate racemase